MRLGRLSLLPAALCVLAAAFATGSAAAGEAPAWMRAQLNVPLPTYSDKTDAVVLYQETSVSVQANGKIKRLHREVIKILRPDGERFGTVRFYFDAESPITQLHAWCIPSSGKDYEVKDRDAVESAVYGIDGSFLMSSDRTKTLQIPASIPGSVIGYESEQELRPYALVDDWDFQSTLPVREAHYALTLPAGWSYKTNWINHAEETVHDAGPGRHEWAVRDLAAIRIEPYMPPWQGVAGSMVVAMIPASGQDPGIQSWRDLGNWYLTLARDRRAASAEMKQKVAALTSSAPTTLAKIQALAAFVQSDVRYVAIELGIGGQQPHAAAEVFNHHYGDCKDKANLLITMLQEIGVTAYEVAINTVRGSITAATPPDLLFNHDIVAIALPADAVSPTLKAVSAHAKFGRLLFFDPTDDLVGLGSLPGGLQANFGLLVTPEGGELVKLPQLGADTSGTTRTAKLTLDEHGTLRGDVHEVRLGDAAAAQRATLWSTTAESDRIKPVEALAAASFSSFEIAKLSVSNLRMLDQPFEWQYSIRVDNYAKTAADLVLLRPRVLGTQSDGFLETKEPRMQAVEFEGPGRNTDVFDIELPPGYEVDELPPAVDIDDGFAVYHSKTESLGHGIRYSRSLEIKELSVPAAKATQLRDLYRSIFADERNSVILKRTTK